MARKSAKRGKQEHDVRYTGILATPLPQHIGTKLDPNCKPSQFNGSDSDWKSAVLALRAREVKEVAAAFEALNAALGIDPAASSVGPDSQGHYWERVARRLMQRHVPAFKTMSPTAEVSRTVTQAGRLGAKPALPTEIAISIEIYRRELASEGSYLATPQNFRALAARVLELLKAFRLVETDTPVKRSYRKPLPSIKTIERYLQKIETAFDDVLAGKATWEQCEYVIHVCPRADEWERSEKLGTSAS